MWELLVEAAGGAFITRRAVERQPPSAAVEGVDLLDAPGVPATLERRGQEGLDDGGAQPGAGDPLAEAEDVGVVVGARHARLVLGAAEGGPHAGELVGAMQMPIPVPQIAIPRSASPALIARAIRAPNLG